MRGKPWRWCMVLVAAAGLAACEDPPGDPGEDSIWIPPDGFEITDTRPEDSAVPDDGLGDGPTEEATPNPVCGTGGVASYIWIANTAEGTLSKLCTFDGVEMARFSTSPLGASGDPSRTSVNLHGDMVVTNRQPETGPSSVTKFRGDIAECEDRNGNLHIDTSRSRTEVLPWGEDECMVWNTPLPNADATAQIGARATAWDGSEDAETGRGGFVWIGALGNNTVYKLDGNDGAIVGHAGVTNQPYGGVMDGRGSFWVVGAMCTVGVCRLARVNTESLEVTYVTVPCGYGISADRMGRIWTSGRTLAGSCVNRLDPTTGENVTYSAAGMANFFRGIAVDNVGSVWVAETSGDVLQVSMEDVTLVNRFPAGPADVVGVAIDYEGNPWAVSQGGSAAIKINPRTYETESFPVGRGPYTYSDMTGTQLRGVIY